MMTQEKRRARVVILSPCETSSTAQRAAASSIRLAHGAMRHAAANAIAPFRSPDVTPNKRSNAGNTSSWNDTSVKPPKTRTAPMFSADMPSPPNDRDVLANTGKISSYPMAIAARNAYAAVAVTVCLFHPSSPTPARPRLTRGGLIDSGGSGSLRAVFVELEAAAGLNNPSSASSSSPSSSPSTSIFGAALDLSSTVFTVTAVSSVSSPGSSSSSSPSPSPSPYALDFLVVPTISYPTADDESARCMGLMNRRLLILRHCEAVSGTKR
mmetsp:Transcript_5907/g.26528  ORF Transcript_5907/g.26528 Transcript_5907/m.26528 type:complete len:268 (-) Transcript_5907:804-1607(-)